MKQNGHYSIENNHWNDIPNMLLKEYLVSNNWLIAEIDG